MENQNKFGELFKSFRIRLGITLREFCLRNHLDAGNISRIERGLASPPQTEEGLKKFALALNLKEGTSDWRQFMDVGFANNGKIPDDIMSDSKLVDKLPIFFRAIRNKLPKDEQLNALLKKIREA